MKTSLKGEVSFVQDDNSESLMKGLSGKGYSKDDIFIIDDQDRMVYYFDASKSGLSNPNNQVYKAIENISKDSFKNPCDTGMDKDEKENMEKDNKDTMDKGDKDKMDKDKMDKSKMEGSDKNSSDSAECDMEIAKPKGKRVKVGKTTDACMCHDMCMNENMVEYVRYYFLAPKAPKKNSKKQNKNPKKGPCSCIPAPKNKKKKIKLGKAKNERMQTGEVMKR